MTRATEAEGTLSSSIQVTADAITAEVTRATGAESGLSSSITAEAGRINLVVEGTGANAKIKAASIAASINDQTGESIVSIAANRVIIDGTTKISDCFTVDANGYLHVAKRTDFAGNVVIGEQGALVLQGQSQEQYSISASSLRNYVKKAAVDSTTNTLQIWNFGDPDNAPSINFSKAAQATLDDTLAWNSGTSRGQGVYCQFTYQTVDSGGARVESDSHFATLDKSRHCVRFWEQYNSGTDTFMVNEYTFDCDPFVSEIKISHSENTTDRSKISGKTSLDFRQSIKDAIDNDFGGLGNWSHVLMTGGGLSFNRGGKEYLGGRLGRAVEDIPRRTTKLNSHSFSSSLGLMDLIIDTIEQQRAPTGGFGSKVAGFFKSLLGG